MPRLPILAPSILLLVLLAAPPTALAAGEERPAGRFDGVLHQIEGGTIAVAPRALDSMDAADLLPRLSEALDAERGWAIADRVQVDRLGEQVGEDALIVEVPAFDQDVHDLAALARVASFLTATA